MFILQQGFTNPRDGELQWLDSEAFALQSHAIEEGEAKGKGVWRVVELVPIWESDAAIEITGGEA
ncbi:hypothetical protein LZK98_11670 [Sphingomonas cannabina]|uniref:hypothetical protein n=1 Tax=Sphingomonas cannabina TaxID=2899123 RepID=UPI001F30D33C|nr:hypothetical protein [Sphingomonas cannabina]UIJ43749.1 hypothetical protein LZK98_11670 [Sphingomonas cannabina]